MLHQVSGAAAATCAACWWMLQGAAAGRCCRALLSLLCDAPYALPAVLHAGSRMSIHMYAALELIDGPSGFKHLELTVLEDGKVLQQPSVSGTKALPTAQPVTYAAVVYNPPQVRGHPANRAAAQPAPASAGGPGPAGAAGHQGRRVRAGGGQQVGCCCCLGPAAAWALLLPGPCCCLGRAGAGCIQGPLHHPWHCASPGACAQPGLMAPRHGNGHAC